MVFQIVTEENFNEIIKGGNVIVNFTSNRTGNYIFTIIKILKKSISKNFACVGPCQIIAPFYEKLAKHYACIRFVQVNVDQLKSVTSSAGVFEIPTVYFYRNGGLMCKISGANRKELEICVHKFASI